MPQNNSSVYELKFEKRKTQNSPIEHIEVILRQSTKNDTIEFNYFFNKTLKNEDDTWKVFLFIPESNELIESFGRENQRSLKLIGTHLKEPFDLLEYEIEHPGVDGDGGILFSPEIGLILLNNYSWTGSILLSEFSNNTINEYLSNVSDSILLDRSLLINRFKFKRGVVIPKPIN